MWRVSRAGLFWFLGGSGKLIACPPCRFDAGFHRPRETGTRLLHCLPTALLQFICLRANFGKRFLRTSAYFTHFVLGPVTQFDPLLPDQIASLRARLRCEEQ